MAIERIVGSGSIPDPIRSKKEKRTEEAPVRSTDSAALSQEARTLFEARRTQKISEIREKIASGAYLQPGVAEKVADALLKHFQITENER